MVNNKMRMRGGFVRPVVQRAQRVVNKIEQMPGGAQLVQAAKQSVRQKVGQYLPALTTAINATAKLRTKRSISQNVIMGQGTTTSYAQLGKRRVISDRNTTKRLVQSKTTDDYIITTSNYGVQTHKTIVESMNATTLKSVGSNGLGTDYMQYIEPIAAKVTTYYTNQDVGNVILYIYDIVARRDHNKNPETAFQDVLDAANSYNWDANRIGVTPFQSKMFTNLFKIWKVTKVELRPGQSHIHTSNVYHNRKLNFKDFLSESNAVTNEMVRGVTSSVFAIAHSLPVLDGNNTTDNLADDSVTFGTPRILCIYTKEESVYNQTPQRTVQYDSFNIPTTVVQQRTRQDDGNILPGEQN